MKIGIIGAMDVEIGMYIEKYNLSKCESTNNDMAVYKGKVGNKELFVTKCGIGKVNSASLTQHLIDKYDIECIINSGCAGALDTKLNVLDTIIASYVCYHDFDPEEIMKISVPDNGKIIADEQLVTTAATTLKNMGVRCYVEPVCTGDCFVAGEEMRDRIKAKTGAVAVDMESASVGHVSKKNNVRFLIIRTISDFSDGAEYKEKEASEIASKLVIELINKM